MLPSTRQLLGSARSAAFVRGSTRRAATRASHCPPASTTAAATAIAAESGLYSAGGRAGAVRCYTVAPRRPALMKAAAVQESTLQDDTIPAEPTTLRRTHTRRHPEPTDISTQEAADASTKSRPRSTDKTAMQSSSASPPPPSSAKANTRRAQQAHTKLRAYQQECIDTCLANLKKGIMRQVVSLPVGSGKTVIFTHMIQNVPSPFPGATKTLVLAHRQELLDQTEAHILRTGTGLSVTIDQGVRNADMDADVIVASVQSLGRLGSARLPRYNPKEFKCIIIDEAHHAAAESYKRILQHFGANNPNTHIFVYGCSATVRRHDGIKLEGVFDYISYQRDFLTMIEEKWLCPLRIIGVETSTDLRGVTTQAGDFALKELSLRVNIKDRNDAVVREYKRHCVGRKATVVFAVNIEHLEELTEAFRKEGFDARGLSSKTSNAERVQLLQDFRDGQFPIIVNCGILTEGTDVPTIDSVIMARPTKSNVLFQQMMGRGMRLSPGKEDCLVLDFVDIVKDDGMVTVPTLLGLDPRAAVNKTKTIRGHQDVEMLVSNPDGLSPDQLLDDTKGIPLSILGESRNGWIRTGADSYMLNAKNISFSIERALSGRCTCRGRLVLKENQVGSLTEGDGGNAGDKPSAGDNSVTSMILTIPPVAQALLRKRMTDLRELDEDKSFEPSRELEFFPIKSRDTMSEGLHAVDAWIKYNMGPHGKIFRRDAPWRQYPADVTQLRQLRGMGLNDTLLRGTQLTSLTMGQASNLMAWLRTFSGMLWVTKKTEMVNTAEHLAKGFGVVVGPILKEGSPLLAEINQMQKRR